MKKRDSNRSPPATVGSEKSHQTIFGRTTQMKKETDLQKIKEYANRLPMTGIAKAPCSPAIVGRPFTTPSVNGNGIRQSSPCRENVHDAVESVSLESDESEEQSLC